MGNFISKIKEISNKLNRSASTDLESPPRNEDAVANIQPDLGTEATPQDENGDPQQQPSPPPEKKPSAINKIWQGLNTPKPLYRSYLFWFGFTLGGGIIAVGATSWFLERSLPTAVDDVITYVRDETLTIKAADGSILQQIGPATRDKLTIEKIPKHLIAAFIAIEDKRFYEHQGVDYQGVIRASVSNLQARNVVEGGSTITQQLARIVYLDQERSFWRKLKEIRLAQKIEQQFNKQKILERYLNLVYLGSGAYGIADASWVYFSKPVEQLTLAEIATLAGLPPAPSVYSPFVSPQAAKERRNVVLREMQKGGYITAKEAQEAIATPLVTKKSSPKRLYREAPYFTDYIQKELPNYVSPEVLEAGGLIVETSLNPKWQKLAEEVVTETVKRNGRGNNFDQAALVAIDPRNGEIKAMVGGKDFYENQFNRVTQAQRQPGSTFKMFVYSTAIAGGFTPYRGYLDSPYTVDGYTPKNYVEKNYRGWVSMRDALTYSTNVVAVKVLVDVGWQPIINLAQKMGIESELKPTYSLALGASEVNLLELTGAYGTLATQGLHTKNHGIRRILNPQGDVIYQAEFKQEPALDKESAAIMTWLLRGVVNQGTGRAAQLDRPVAGKTGTSDEARDLWFIGYIPQLVTGVWLGNDSNKPTWGASSTAAATWNRFMVKAVEGMPVEQFPPRPDKLEGRKATIKLEPLKPKRIFSGRIKNDDDADEDNSRSKVYRRRRYQDNTQTSDNYSSDRPRRRRYQDNSETRYNSSDDRTRRRRRRVEVQAEEPTPRYRRRARRTVTENNSETPTPRRRRISQTQQRVRQAAPIERPPAPPASRREVQPETVAPPPAPPASRREVPE